MTPYETLCVPPDADDAAIRAAYRKLAQKHHPDKGGDLNLFREIQKAYDLIGTAEAREYFALHGGEAPCLGHVESEALGQITSIFSNWLDATFKGEPVNSDPIWFVRAALDREMENIARAQRQLQENLKKVKRMRGRFSAGNGEVNVFETRLEEVSSLVEQNLREVQKASDRVSTSLAMLSSFTYTPEEGMKGPAVRAYFITTGTTSATGW